MPAALEQVKLVGRLLSTNAAGQQVAVDRSNEAGRAYASAETDRLTGLRSRRGWQGARGTVTRPGASPRHRPRRARQLLGRTARG